VSTSAVAGPDVRADVLRELVPRLDRLSAGVEESEELTDELWGELARSPHALLDPRGEVGRLGLERLTRATEALATGSQTYLMPLLLTALPSVAVLLDGTDEQRTRLLGPIRSGHARAAFALTEPGAGSDVSATATTAERRDSEEFVLRGRKSWISIPRRVDWILVFARPAGDGHPGHALSCFAVDADASGLRLEPSPATLGMRAIPLCDVVLDDVRVPAENLVGEEGRAFGIAMRVLNAVRPIVAARGLGLTAKVIMAATEHVESRHAFGGPLFDQQAVRLRLAGLAARLEAARLLTYQAARAVDENGPGKTAAPLLAAAKYLATELAVDAAGSCLHLAGAAGYSAALPFERAVRDAQQLTIVEGTSEIQLELVARGLADRTMWWST
jgi:alkylation response protein AidB-like acyl-CoA dehydrogenase